MPRAKLRVFKINESRSCNAFELLKQEKELKCIKTNISKLDNELNGGIRMVSRVLFK